MADKIGDFTLNHLNRYDIDIAGNKTMDDVEKADWAPLAAGINSVTPTSNETVDNSAYYDGGGYESDDVTGMREQLAFAGHRKEGDPAQDFVASKEHTLGNERKTLLRWTKTDGTVVTGMGTMSGIVTSGGVANAKQTFNMTFTYNGEPEVKQAGDNDGGNGDGSGE